MLETTAPFDYSDCCVAVTRSEVAEAQHYNMNLMVIRFELLDAYVTLG